jgi:ATP-dependent RNA helicase DeaD
MFIQRIAKTAIKKLKVPNIRDIIKAKKKKINEDITVINSDGINKTYYNWAKELLDNNNPTQILAKLLNYSFDSKLDPGLYNEIQDLSGKNRKIEMGGRTRLFVALGKKDKISPSKLIKFIIQNTGVRNSVIDQVGVYNDFSFITVPFKEAEIILGVFQKKSGKKKSLIVKARKKQKSELIKKRKATIVK